MPYSSRMPLSPMVGTGRPEVLSEPDGKRTREIYRILAEGPMTQDEICSALGVVTSRDRRAVRSAIESMCKSGRAVRSEDPERRCYLYRRGARWRTSCPP